MGAGLYQTAIAELEPIIAAAIDDRAYPEAIKAIGRKLALEGNIQGNKAEEKITRLQAEIERAPAEMRPVMEAILARWYWHFFQQNRWRFHERTQTAEPPGDDILTWDLARILAEIDRHFTAALADADALKATPISEYNALLASGTAPDAYRPTLFDFVVYEALEFYQAGENGPVIAEEEFPIEAANSPIFGPADEFMRWSPATSDEKSPALKAVRLLQALLRFHARDADRSAFLDADLARLLFGLNHAIGEERDARYRAALERFIAATEQHEISARARHALARHLQEAGELVAARAIAQRGLDSFPNTAGAAACFNLIQEIEAPSLELQTERVWNAPWPTLDVTYRNLTRVHLRAVAIDFIDYVEDAGWQFGHIDEEEMLAQKPVLAWAADLPATIDFAMRTEKLAAPSTLAPGLYCILASTDATFSAEENFISGTFVWVSDLALVMQLRDGTRASTGLVLHATSGEPIAGASIRFWRRNRDGDFRPAGTTRSDEQGRFELPREDGELVLLARHGAHLLSNRDPLRHYSYDRDREDYQTVFFTDRALYRPGQTIHYKGISFHADFDASEYKVAARREVTVVFNDPNGKEVARATHRTNDFGSFSGVFTAPRDRLMGQMAIMVPGESHPAWFSVEEYKRPKFQVQLDPPENAPKLDAPVEVRGRATAYTGAAIDGAQVTWRVERTVGFPVWCWWWAPPEVKAIAHGRAVTAADGSFSIEFDAAPDRTVPAALEPVFTYQVFADVTDSAGETRSSERVVRAGYTALQATIDLAEWQTANQPVAFTLGTTSLDEEPQPARGTLTVHVLQEPAHVVRAPLANDQIWWEPTAAAPENPANPDTWELGRAVFTRKFETDESGAAMLSAELNAGVYRAVLETKDRFGRKVTARRTFQVVDPEAKAFRVKRPHLLTAMNWTVEPGQTFTALWGTGYESGRAFVELECNGRTLWSYWTDADRTQTKIEQAVTEELRGGFTLRVTYVRENRAYLEQHVVQVPWTNKQLDVKWEIFRSKLQPGQEETWTAVITGPDAEPHVAEMVATLYDASLDQFRPHSWPNVFPAFRHEYSDVTGVFENVARDFVYLTGTWPSRKLRVVDWRYRSLPPELAANLVVYGAFRGWAGGAEEETVVLSPFEVMSDSGHGYVASTTLAGNRLRTELKDIAAGETDIASPAVVGRSGPNLDQVVARRNLNETAFFFPQLISGDDGVVKLRFTMSEALTEWKFLGFAHDRELRAGFLTDKIVTAKDVMVQPNPPRFIREGDALEFTVKVTNLSDVAQSGTVRLTFADAATLESRDAAVGNRATEQPFEVPAKQSRSYSWRITVPDGLGFLSYKAVGATAMLSDGEEGFLPVLSRRILVRESLPLPIRGRTTKQFDFAKLRESGASDTLRHQSLTVQMVSQPAWYAVMALPYLMEYPYECSEQVFNRLYANTLARHIANSNPKIRRIFDLWKNTPALESPLEKNQDLKSVLLEETPWVREAENESQARRNVGLLFDENRLQVEAESTLRKLADRQLSSGLWSWFPGGPPNEYISLYIVTGFGRLRNLGAEIDVAPAVRALAALDTWMQEQYRRIPDRTNYVITPLDALYLYGRSFFVRDQPIDHGHREAVDFYLRRAREAWLQVDSRQSQAHLAIALHRFGDQDTAQAIMRSIKERSVTDEELGMFWRDLELSWWWYHAPIETQALMIEAFAEVANDAQAVEDCKVWLLKQKQTQDWKTTKATADAVYALLLRGENLLASDALVEVALGGETITPEHVEAGTGFYEQKFVPGEITPAMGRITVTKVDDGVSWGGVHWQYLEDMTKVTPHAATPLRLKKTLFVKETTSAGPVLQPVRGALAVGDELVVRIELRTDRDMEYVHLKDQRGSGTEPVNVLSRYQYQDGLAYYESTRDTASHFFIDYLPKGTYVFEYSTHVQHRGAYQSGIAEIQCMYAPEFNSHSESMTLEVK